MWKTIASILIRRKISLLVGVIIITGFMIFQTSKITLSYDFARILPDNDSTYSNYMEFKKKFGEDGNVMVLGFSSDQLFSEKIFNNWKKLGMEVKAINGIKDIMSVSNLYNLYRNDSLNKFDFKPITPAIHYSQSELDTIKKVIQDLPFYEGLVFNKETGATLMAITFNSKDLNSVNRINIVKSIMMATSVFEKENNVKVHYSGMPYIRTHIMQKVSGEMGLFMALAVIVTAIILWIFFRTFSSVIISLIVAGVGVLWSLGVMQLFGYKITILSGLIPPLIIVIGIPNCVF
ncbi:MAG: MMPL family transporter, partial [Bacteroidia bacterium]|nr:MMPL family transporter [Bacteroidia bacterium]